MIRVFLGSLFALVLVSYLMVIAHASLQTITRADSDTSWQPSSPAALTLPGATQAGNRR
jgi:hypothetical protein